MATSPQRAYRATCPNCGAPVELASAASASAVCSFCRSTLVRDGAALRRIGTSAELFDDHSPLQMGASGQRQGLAFTLVGRLQYRYDGGTWNEWHALFDAALDADAPRSAWLSEDNGAYVLAFDAPLPADAPADEAALAALRAGQRVLAEGRAWDVASVVRAKLLAAQGELPRAPRLELEFVVADLRNSAGEVATLDSLGGLDSGSGAPRASLNWSVGRAVTLAELRISGLKDSSEKTLGGRSLSCPSCGNALEVKLATTQSLSCGQCAAVVDISAGIGAELKHYAQNNAGEAGAEPLIALGSSGKLALGSTGAEPPTWQVVGYQERCDIPDDAEEDTTFWREYLLFNRQLGFAFLVDSNEGWSWVKPLTGAPTVRGDKAQWQGQSYSQRFSYGARVTWVQGEFYWRVQRDERARVTDYEGSGAARGARLSREQTANEVTWSAGHTLEASVVADAFGIAPGARAALQRDTAPLSSAGVKKSFKVGLIVIAVVIALVLLTQCSGNDCDDVRSTFGASSAEYQQCQRNASSGGVRTGGGSFGGRTSGGGDHK